MTPLRKRAFFTSVEKADLHAFKLRMSGLKDVCLVLHKNKEDCARLGSALARIEGAFVVWTEDPNR